MYCGAARHAPRPRLHIAQGQQPGTRLCSLDASGRRRRWKKRSLWLGGRDHASAGGRRGRARGQRRSRRYVIGIRFGSPVQYIQTRCRPGGGRIAFFGKRSRGQRRGAGEMKCTLYSGILETVVVSGVVDMVMVDTQWKT